MAHTLHSLVFLHCVHLFEPNTGQPSHLSLSLWLLEKTANSARWFYLKCIITNFRWTLRTA